jgi:hypothetical protein
VSERTLAIAATNLLARGFLVVPTVRKSRAGAPVNGLYAVARAVLHVLDWKGPARAVAIVDRHGRQWPELLVSQLEQLPALLRALGVSVVEADQEPHVVASYTRAAVAAGDDVVIVGVDKRFAQLVTKTVWWYDANKDARYTPEIVKKRFGVAPAQVGDWLALVGDDDQVPGISGIGAKGATQLLDAHGAIEMALASIATLEGRARKALEAARDEVSSHLARARLNLARALPLQLADCAFNAPEPAPLNAHLDALGFVELLVSVAAPMRVGMCTSPRSSASCRPRSKRSPGTPSTSTRQRSSARCCSRSSSCPWCFARRQASALRTKRSSGSNTPRFHHARSFSGELVNTNPDLGRVPGRTPEMAEIRRAFVAPPGRLLMSVDFNQLGLYVLARLTKDPALVEPLRERADVHCLTASAVLDKPADQITLEERQIGKVVNFATFAGQGASALALQLGITAAEAKQYIARFDRRYARVRAFQDERPCWDPDRQAERRRTR